MKIKTLLLACSVILLSVTTGIAIIVIGATRHSGLTERQSLAAARLVRQFFEQSTLVQEYVAHHEDRPRHQWYLEEEAIQETLSDPVLQAEPSRSRLPELRAGIADLKRVFDELVRVSSAAEEDVELERQFSGDLLVHSRAITRIADDLATQAAETHSRARILADRAVLLLLAFLALLITVVLAFLYRRIVGSLRKLQAGARAVGAGDLGYRIGGGATDEIGDVSRAFDGMTAKLKASYDTLEEKIRERTRELQALSDKNRTLLQSIGDAVVAIDRYWNITAWNPAAGRMTGWQEREVLGKPFRDHIRFIHEHDRRENLAFIEEAMLYGEVRQMSGNTLLLARDGREVPVGDSAAPIFDENGTLTGVIVVFRDATKEREASLLRTDFAYASHQLRTPVTKALWDLELGLDEAKDPAIRKRIEVAYRSVKDVQKLSDRLIRVSEIDQKRIVPEYGEIEVGSFLNGLVAEIGKGAAARGIQLAINELPRDARMDADQKLLSVAVREILENAILYSRAGGRVEVELRLQPLEFILQVRDHGIGISEEQKPLIFTKFFRGQNVPAEAAGAGLGLFIAREYVRLMDGKLWFESELGKGTTFTISLPRLRGMQS